MLKAKLVSLVNICTRHAWVVITIGVLLAVISGIYTVRSFKINTDVNQLISRDLPWRQRELAYSRAFPGGQETILVVVKAPTSELASAASKALSQKLSQQPNLFKSVE